MQVIPPRIRFQGVSKSYGGVRALQHVGFDVEPGTVHALVGENGAGKSTLIKILAGAVIADQGLIEIDGRTVSFRHPRAAQAAGVAVVHQELSIAPHLSVSENVFLGRWPRGRFIPLVRFDELHERADLLFNELGYPVPVTHPAGTLGVAQQQMVEIARALSQQAGILVLDEPSAVLTPYELVSLFRVVRDLKQRGVSILYVSHRLDEIYELADQVTVLRDGRHISTQPIGGLARDQLITAMVGRSLDSEYPVRRCDTGPVVMAVKNLTAPGRFEDVSFELHAGEVFGLTGMVGSGRSSVGRALFGDVPETRGTICMGGRETTPFASPRAAIRSGVVYIPEDRKRDGLLLMRSVRENLTLAYRGSTVRCGMVNLRSERRFARQLIEQYRIRSAGTEVEAATLSGGNQQILLLARWLHRPQPVVILDEPTRGVDVGAKAEIYELIHGLVDHGAAVLLITSELPEVIGLADRIGVMSRGRLVGMLNNQNRNVTQAAILELAAGSGAQG